MSEQRGPLRHGQGEAEQVLRPAVDIFEQPHGITLLLDLPGVTREQLGIHVEGNVLTIEGAISIDMPEGMTPLYAEVRATRYQRSFTLSGEMDAERISAEVKEGVLVLHVPKRSESRPRRIEVSVG